MSSGEKVRLGDVCEIVSGATPKTKIPEYWEGNIKWVTPAELGEDSHYICDTEKHLTEKGFSSASLHLMPKGTVLLTTRAPIGKVAITTDVMCCNQGFKNLVCSEKVYNEYLYRYLRSRTAELQAMGRGATFKELSKKNVSEYTISLPPLPVQREAVEKLSAVEKQVYCAEQQIAQLDQLVKSRFVEMFGDLSSYESKALKECVLRIESGKSPKCLTTPREGDGPAVLKLSAISSGTYEETENKALPLDTKIIEEKVVCSGDILLSRKNTPELVGRSVLVSHTNGNIMFPDIVFRMHARPEINEVYLSHVLAYPLFGSIRALAHGSAKSMSNIPKSELAELAVPLPPLALQQDFATFVTQVDKTRAIAQQQIDKLQTLYDSLAQDYFA